MANTDNELPKDPKAWAEHLANIDWKDHKKAMFGVGAAALFGMGAGVYGISRRAKGGKFFVNFGDRYMESKRVISIGELAEGGGAVSAAIDEEAIERVGDGYDVFSLDPEDGIGHPLSNPEHIPKHTTALRRAAGWMIDHFRSQAESEE